MDGATLRGGGGWGYIGKVEADLRARRERIVGYCDLEDLMLESGSVAGGHCGDEAWIV